MKYDRCRQWIKEGRNNGAEWAALRLACKKNDEELEEFLKRRISEDFYPSDLTVDEWQQIVEQLEETEQHQQELYRASMVASLKDNTADSGVSIPTDKQSAWQLYRKRLIEVNGFAEDAVDGIEQTCISILNRLRNNTIESGPIQGLVLGNVQSGKTANMAGLMAMAADHNWNMFIVLSGTIENLRNQTQNRLFRDLQSEVGNLQWQQLNNPSRRHSGIGFRACDLHFNNSNYRYITVCLKQSTRLRDLIEWIQADKNVIRQMKVMVIDDEADQASINTGDIHESNERKTINRLILNLVNCRDVKARTDEDNHYTSHYAAMNYISYTATPYANCLNESGKNTLYPKNFIQTLPISLEYFGVEQLFGGHDPESNTLDIIRNISDDDVEIIKQIHEEESTEIPPALQEAILWFICAAAVMRFYQYKKPVSMLVHTSLKQPAHEAITNQIKEWLTLNRKAIPTKCRELYSIETNRFTKQSLRDSYPKYEIPDEQIWDYPDFDSLKEQDFIDEILMKYFETLNDLHLLEDEFYLKIKYGTCNSNVICLLKNGISLSLALLLVKKYSQYIYINDEKNDVTYDGNLVMTMKTNNENDIFIFEMENNVYDNYH